MNLGKTRSFIEDDRGATIVEAGIVLPIFLLVTLASLYWALTLWQQVTLQHAVEMGARCATLSVATETSASPYCGYVQCSGAACSTSNAIALNDSSMQTQTTGSTVCAYSQSYTNKFLVNLLPMLPTTLNASYCLTTQQ